MNIIVSPIDLVLPFYPPTKKSMYASIFSALCSMPSAVNSNYNLNTFRFLLFLIYSHILLNLSFLRFECWFDVTFYSWEILFNAILFTLNGMLADWSLILKSYRFFILSSEISFWISHKGFKRARFGKLKIVNSCSWKLMINS